VPQVSARFEADVSMMLDCLPASGRQVLPGLVSRVLVAHATDQGADLFATIDTEVSSRSQLLASASGEAGGGA
jgi:hypothetical protein